MIHFEKLTDLWIPCTTTIGGNWIFSILSNNNWQKPLGNEHVSLSHIYSEDLPVFFCSIIIQSHINSGPTLSNVSSTMNSAIVVLFEDVFLKWHFWIHFQIATWILLTISRHDNALITFLKDEPRKYKYKLS
jgi:hypothetical protein